MWMKVEGGAHVGDIPVNAWSLSKGNRVQRLAVVILLGEVLISRLRD